jgi:hypothetical protein
MFKTLPIAERHYYGEGTDQPDAHAISSKTQHLLSRSPVFVLLVPLPIKESQEGT